VQRADRQERDLLDAAQAVADGGELADDAVEGLPDQSTRSILLTATTRWGTRSSDAIDAWRRVCSTTPLRASTRTMARSAVDAPVTMLRVYCTWPGVSARMKRRLVVAK
jgi:hypothetical protein